MKANVISVGPQVVAQDVRLAVHMEEFFAEDAGTTKQAKRILRSKIYYNQNNIKNSHETKLGFGILSILSACTFLIYDNGFVVVAFCLSASIYLFAKIKNDTYLKKQSTLVEDLKTIEITEIMES